MRVFNIICFSFLFAVTPSGLLRGQQNGKDRVPTQHETEQWIIDKLLSHVSNIGDTYHGYRFYFESYGESNSKDRMMKIEHTQYSGISMVDGTFRSQVHVADIMNVTFVRKNKGTWMTISLMENVGPETCVRNEFVTNKRVVNVILNNSVNEDDLPNRLRKAFSALVQMSGGAPFYVDEPY